jgi:hypothetical protein
MPEDGSQRTNPNWEILEQSGTGSGSEAERVAFLDKESSFAPNGDDASFRDAIASIERERAAAHAALRRNTVQIRALVSYGLERGFNRAQMARMLGMSRQALYALLKQRRRA